MNVEMVARNIQIILAPVVLVTACAILAQGLLGRYAVITDRLLALTAAKKGNKAVEVRVEPVAKKDLVASVTASGQVTPETKVDLSSDVSGKITLG